MNLKIGFAAARGRLYAKEFSVLNAGPYFGHLMVSGDGPNGVKGDFDDGVYGEFDLFTAELESTVRLFQKIGNVAKPPFAGWDLEFLCAPGVACNPLAPHVLKADGEINMEVFIPGIGVVRLEGTTKIDTGAKTASVSGKVSVPTFDLVMNATVSLDANGLDFTASVVASYMGVQGKAEVDWSLDFDPPELSGSGTVAVIDYLYDRDLYCTGSGSISMPYGLQVKLGDDCDLFALGVCLGDGHCPNSKFCDFPYCHTPLSNGAVCNRNAACDSGHCATKCYEPLSKEAGEICNKLAADHCKTGHVCCTEGACADKCVKLNIPEGETCTDFRRCAEGFKCAGPGTKRCRYQDRPDGEACVTANNGRECLQGHGCFAGKCGCTADNQCPSDQFCSFASTGSHRCEPRRVSGGCSRDRVCLTNQCNNSQCRAAHNRAYATACCSSNCTDVNLNEACMSGVCTFGVCACNDDGDCPNAAHHCTGGDCVAPVAEAAACQSNRWCAAGAACINVATSGAPNLRCITQGTLVVAAVCQFNQQCASGSCATRSGSTKECKCVKTGDCPNPATTFCGPSGSSTTCTARVVDFNACIADERCLGNVCLKQPATATNGKCLTLGAKSAGQNCVDVSHCAAGLACLQLTAASGVQASCFAPGTRLEGQVCTSPTHCKGGVCMPPGSTGIRVCGCDATSCATGKFCNPAGVCVDKLAGKEQCVVNGVGRPEMCRSGLCKWGQCACTDAATHCPANHYCEDFYCKGQAAANLPCKRNEQCRGNLVCKDLPASQGCSTLPNILEQQMCTGKTCRP